MHKKHFFLSNNIAEARGFSPRNRRSGDHSYQQEIELSMVKW